MLQQLSHDFLAFNWEQIIQVKCIIKQAVNFNAIVNFGSFRENVSGVKHHVHPSCLLFLEHTSSDYYKDMNSPLKGKHSG